MVTALCMLQVADIPVDHPSCSKQHCVLQYRLVERDKEDGGVKRVIRWVWWGGCGGVGVVGWVGVCLTLPVLPIRQALPDRPGVH